MVFYPLNNILGTVVIGVLLDGFEHLSHPTPEKNRLLLMNLFKIKQSLNPVAGRFVAVWAYTLTGDKRT
jgi:hypothetical protein